MRVRVAIAALLTAVAAGCGAVTAGAAVVSGSNLAGAAPSAAFCAEPASCTMAIADLPPASSAAAGPRAAINGVIVSWRVRLGDTFEAQSVRLRLVRNDVGAGTGSVVTLQKLGGTYEFPARLPVGANDLIGIDLVDAKGSSGLAIFRPTTGASFDYWKPPLGDEELRSANIRTIHYEMLLNVTIEPDADNDGWGDETQDKCVGKADPTNACPPAKESVVVVCDLAVLSCPQPPARPDTKLGKNGTKGVSTTRKGTFRFTSTVSGSTFQCKLDKKSWEVCKSPKIYRSLQEGQHTFRVRAVGPTGLVDTTPAKRSFKVEL